ncbi:hypothetical protein ACJIZ3_007624 [Penstemon smallii]|uniref:DC1 domain-containing protein n=1 Tax=Penstemon smallii TaxID=265156 RepID=A0ABD3T8X7_9LAMI
MKHFSHPHELSAAPMVSSHEIPFSTVAQGAISTYTNSALIYHMQSIHSKSHIEHSLGLLYPPYCSGPCDACGESCDGFTYNCNLCNYNVHANCLQQINENDVGSSSTNKHFSHPHTLNLLEPLGMDKYYDETMIITCSVCEQLIPVNSGAAYECPNRVCDFIFHKSCFDTPRTILNHKSHPNHPLGLLSEPPQYSLYYNCTACGDLINGFSYQCKECDDFRLHAWHNKHPLVLLYRTPPKSNVEQGFYNIVSCGVCDNGITEGYWSYYCKDCDFVTDLNCAFSAEVEPPTDDEKEDNDEEEEVNDEEKEEEDDEEEEEELSDAMKLTRANIKAMNQMAITNFQLQMAQLNARTIANMWR